MMSTRRTAATTARGQRTWIFQANPNKYRIEESLQIEGAELWNLNQHTTEVEVGDRVLVWISGRKAGIYAIGTVTTSPLLQADSTTGQEYWRDPREGRRAKARVGVRYDRVLLDRPLGKTYLEWDPQLRNLAILRRPRGTNFTVSEEEWAALRVWLEDDEA